MATRADVTPEADLVALRRQLVSALRLRPDVAYTDASLVGLVRALGVYDAEVDALRVALGRPTPDGVGLAAVAELHRLRGLVASLGGDADARRVGEAVTLVRAALRLPEQVSAARVAATLGRIADGWVSLVEALRAAQLDWDLDDVGVVASVRLLTLRLEAARRRIRALEEERGDTADEAPTGAKGGPRGR